MQLRLREVPSLAYFACKSIPYSETVNKLCLWTREKKCLSCHNRICNGKCENIHKCESKYIIHLSLPGRFSCPRCDNCQNACRLLAINGRNECITCYGMRIGGFPLMIPGRGKSSYVIDCHIYDNDKYSILSIFETGITSAKSTWIYDITISMYISIVKKDIRSRFSVVYLETECKSEHKYWFEQDGIKVDSDLKSSTEFTFDIQNIYELITKYHSVKPRVRIENKTKIILEY